MDAILEKSYQLKQALVDFVLDAEGELATSLEAYAAEQSRRKSGDNQQDLIVDSFIIEGKVGDRIPIELFIASQPKLTESDRNLISDWRRSFIGLFTVVEVLSDGFELQNWLTTKNYIVKPNNPQTIKELLRCQVGDILLTRIAPIADYWTFFSKSTILGKLGKPKLAVAIGNFKDNYKHSLYGDAPELLQQAWQSVDEYHQQFIEFFGSDEITMSGYHLNKKVAEFQELLMKQNLSAAGLDDTKSLAELAQDAGLEQSEIEAAAKESGADTKVVAQLFDKKSPTKMVAPKIELPAELKKAEQVTSLSHPRWGQIFLPTYSKFKTIIEAPEWQSIEGAEKLIRYYLENPTINVFIWQRLAQQYPQQLEKILQQFLELPDFKVDQLSTLLQDNFDKPLEPELPETASVPVHLNNLFEEAVAEVNKSKKTKTSKKVGSGFQKP
ncbi:hypothetical protein [Synechocystis sp. PCC 7509]|uniref:hypothetical protein n=1 Tax=Synechocystis sp. PCC 7509 TaxID=927677 RepID=UPI0002ACFF49|nr:hypothetical protein [Synechocystis sp. PCC 7509]